MHGNIPFNDSHYSTLLYLVRFKQAMRVAVTQSLSQLIETTTSSFNEILFGIPHSVPIFILMPKQNSLSLPFTIMPVSVINKLAGVSNPLDIIVTPSLEAFGTFEALLYIQTFDI